MMPLDEPHVWKDYDSATRTIVTTGDVIPCTCPISTRPDLALYSTTMAMLPAYKNGMLKMNAHRYLMMHRFAQIVDEEARNGRS